MSEISNIFLEIVSEEHFRILQETPTPRMFCNKCMAVTNRRVTRNYGVVTGEWVNYDCECGHRDVLKFDQERRSK